MVTNFLSAFNMHQRLLFPRTGVLVYVVKGRHKKQRQRKSGVCLF